MVQVVKSGSMLLIGATIRIEPSPRLVEGVADEATLSDEVTADHYHAPRPATQEEIDNPQIDTPDGIRTAIDRDGSAIVLGGPFRYLDWNGFKAGLPESTVYSVSVLEDCTEEELEQRLPRDMKGNFTGAPVPEELKTIWRHKGDYDTEEEALGAALEFIGE